MTLTNPRRLLGVLAALTAAIAVVLVVAVTRGDSTGRAAMREMSPRELGAFAHDSGHPVFWIGAQPGAQLSAGRSSNGSVVVKYGGGVFDGLMVATYAIPDAAANLRRQAKRDKRYEIGTIDDGRVILIDRENGSHAYLAKPGADEQIEISSGRGDQALRLATEGRIVTCC